MIRYRGCKLDQARQPTQQCFTDANALIYNMASEMNSGNITVDWETTSGKGCICFSDRCNNISFREFVALPINGAPAVKDVSTSATTSSPASNVGLSTSHVVLFQYLLMNQSVDQDQHNFRDNEEITEAASPTSDRGRPITSEASSTRAPDNEVTTADENKNDKPMIQISLLFLCLVVTLLF